MMATARLMSPKGGWNFDVLRMADKHVEAYNGHPEEPFLETFVRYRLYAMAQDGDFDGDRILERVDNRYIPVRYTRGGSPYEYSLHTFITEDGELNDKLLEILEEKVVDYFKDVRIRSPADLDALSIADAPVYALIARDIAVELIKSFFNEDNLAITFPDGAVIEWYTDSSPRQHGYFFAPGIEQSDEYAKVSLAEVRRLRRGAWTPKRRPSAADRRTE